MNNYDNTSLLIDKISDIKNDLIKFNSIYDELNLILKETVLIDDEIPCYNEMIDLKETTNNMVNEISNEIIPIFSRKN